MTSPILKCLPRPLIGRLLYRLLLTRLQPVLYVELAVNNNKNAIRSLARLKDVLPLMVRSVCLVIDQLLDLWIGERLEVRYGLHCLNLVFLLIELDAADYFGDAMLVQNCKADRVLAQCLRIIRKLVAVMKICTGPVETFMPNAVTNARCLDFTEPFYVLQKL